MVKNKKQEFEGIYGLGIFWRNIEPYDDGKRKANGLYLKDKPIIRRSKLWALVNVPEFHFL